VRITHLTLYNFRCFNELNLSFEEPLIIVEGANGSGKSSIAEALYYACYLKSFRTHRIGDMALQGGNDSFFLRLHGQLPEGDSYTIQVGFERGEKLVKVNDVPVTTYKEVMDYYKVVLISEYDLRIIQEGPEERRAFINQLCVLQDPLMAELLRANKQILNQRLPFLLRGETRSDHFMHWSRQLWENSTQLVAVRKSSLTLLEEEVQGLANSLGITLPLIKLTYKQKGGNYESFEEFWRAYQNTLLPQEEQQRRTLFGSHLDDITISFGGRDARLYASRGQQKLLVLLLKAAIVRVLQRLGGDVRTILFILDDFVTDLDVTVMAATLDMLQRLGCSVLVTCPLKGFVRLSAAAQVVTLEQGAVPTTGR